MAGRWWRYNPTTHIFEQSLNEGDTWAPPPLNASVINEGVFDPVRLGGALAYTNVTNIFTARQIIDPITGNPNTYQGLELRGTYTGGKHASMVFHEPAGGVNQKKWRIIAYNNEFYIERLDDAETTVPQKSVKLDSGGNLWLTAALVVTTATHGKNGSGFLYPGRSDLGDQSTQSSWYLSSHGSYGLYTNAGIFVGDQVWVNGSVIYPSAQVASSNANSLDDYEEGTFTPTLTTSAGFAVHAIQAGWYVKVGRKVYVSGRIMLSNKNTMAAGALSVVGLPFVADNPFGQGYHSFYISHWAGLASNIAVMGGLILLTTASFDIRTTTGGVLTIAQLTAANIGNGFDMIFSGSYTTTS